MKIYSKYLIVFIAVFSFSILMPYFYALIFVKNTDKDFIYYSEIIDDFAIRKFKADRSVIYKDKAENIYSESEFKQILPQVYTRDLVLNNKYSEIINNKIVSAEDMIKYNFYLSTTADKIDEENIRIKLTPVFETQSGSASLSMPADLARVGKDITFINARNNMVDTEKSKLFTSELLNNGFAFPVKIFGANPDVRKSFDAGIFLLDSNNKLFNLKMVKGNPVIEKYNVDLGGEDIIFISIKENQYADFYGYILSKSGNIYLINTNNTLSKLTVENYNPYKDSLRININPLHILVNVTKEKEQTSYLYNKKYEFIKSYTLAVIPSLSGASLLFFNIIFPFSIYTDAYTAAEYLKFEISSNMASSLIFIIILIILYFIICRYFKSISKTIVIDMAVIALSGIYGFTALLLLQNYKKDTLWE